MRVPRPAARSHGPAPSVSTGAGPRPRPWPCGAAPRPPGAAAAGCPAAGACCAIPGLSAAHITKTPSATQHDAVSARVREEFMVNGSLLKVVQYIASRRKSEPGALSVTLIPDDRLTMFGQLQPIAFW